MDKDEVARKILDYLQKHPAAGDTLEGITRWWLGLVRIEESVGEVKECLEELIKRGVLKRNEVQGRTAYYKMKS